MWYHDLPRHTFTFTTGSVFYVSRTVLKLPRFSANALQIVQEEKLNPSVSPPSPSYFSHQRTGNENVWSHWTFGYGFSLLLCSREHNKMYRIFILNLQVAYYKLIGVSSPWHLPFLFHLPTVRAHSWYGKNYCILEHLTEWRRILGRNVDAAMILKTDVDGNIMTNSLW
jgi:hypothetical protein